jgi:DNA-binding transcriptional LysR family regulator
MKRITANDVFDLDLNLLRVLAMVLQERSATAAAQRLHVTQSAVSNSLARLRRLFGDPLFTRSGKGLVPTPLGSSIMPGLMQALAQMQEVVSTHLTFDPGSSRRRFTLACTDAHHFHDVPALAEALARQLPKAELHIVSPDFMESSDGLRSGSVDAALMPHPAVPPGQPYAELYEEGFAFVVRKGNPHVRASLSVQQFNAQRHIDTLIVQARGGIGHKLAGEMFAGLGLVRDVALSVPSFSAAGLAAARSDFVAGLPARLAEILCTLLPLRQVAVPLPAVAFPMCLTWHMRADADPGARYFRQVVVDTLRRANAPKPARKSRKR